MKKFLVVVAVAMLVAFAAATAMAGTGVIGSKHDLATGSDYAGGTLSACQYCHTPHHAVTTTIGTEAAAPLWNRTMWTTANASDGVATYSLYDSGGGGVGAEITLSGTAVGQPGLHSRTCLSCHDGLTAVNGVVNGAALSATVTGAALTGGVLTSATTTIGTDLTDDHPVGIVYNSAAVGSKAGLDLVSFTASASHANGWMIYGGFDAVGTVECGSCHDPHTRAAGQSPFLKGALLTICTDCHSNK